MFRTKKITGRIKRKVRDEEGAVMIIAALGIVAFLSISSLVVDLGLRYYQKSEMQNALDASALAAATKMPNRGEATKTALEYMDKNGISSEDVIVEFPNDDTVRVRKEYECKTLFATVFNSDEMVINAKAAAKYTDKKMSIDFDYLMFYGDDSTFDLRGDIRLIDGSIFGNGNVNLIYNDGGEVHNVVSAKKVLYDPNRTSLQNVLIESNASKQAMPDWDELIMSICPEATESAFLAPHSHISGSRRYLFDYPDGHNLFSVSGNTRCRGNLTSSYSNQMITVVGDLYVDGNFTPQCPVYVTGDVYVGGYFAPAWDMSVRIDGELYVEGKCDFSGATHVGGNVWSGDTITLNGNKSCAFGKSVYCMGGFVKNWGPMLTVRGDLYAYKNITINGGGQNVLHGDIYAFGKKQTGDVVYLSGPLEVDGNLWCGNGNIKFGGNGDCVFQGFIYGANNIITVSGGDISLNGCMIAEGDIDIEGASHTYNDAGATLSLYSRRGNIILGSQGTALKMWGIVYAPHGDIRIKTNGLTVYGSLVGKTLTCDIGSGFYISRNDRTLPFAKTMKVAALVE